MIDRIIQKVLTVVLGVCTLYVLCENWLPSSMELVQLKTKTKISKYFISLLFGISVSWTLIGDVVATRSKTSQAFYHLGRVIAQGIVFSAGLEYLTKTEQKDVVLLTVIRVFCGITFLLLLWNARKLVSTKAARKVELRCGDPLSQTLLLDGLLQLFVSISLLTYPHCVPSLFSATVKLTRLDLFILRVFAGTNFGLSMINFSSLGLPDADATSFLSVRKTQYLLMLTTMFIFHSYEWFSMWHNGIVFGLVLQLIYILLPQVKSELKME